MATANKPVDRAVTTKKESGRRKPKLVSLSRVPALRPSATPPALELMRVATVEKGKITVFVAGAAPMSAHTVIAHADLEAASSVRP